MPQIWLGIFEAEDVLYKELLSNYVCTMYMNSTGRDSVLGLTYTRENHISLITTRQ